MVETRYETKLRAGRISMNIDDDVVPLEDIEWLLQFFRDAAKDGAVFADGETIQIGWAVGLMKEKSADELGMYEPDFRSVPIVFRDSVTTTLQHLRMHRDVVESVGLEADFPSLRQSAITCSALRDGERRLILHRVAADDPTDSGLFVGCADPQHDHSILSNLQRLSLYVVALRWPSILPFIALPADTQVRLLRGTPEIFMNGEQLKIRPGSFLDHLVFGPEEGKSH